MTRKKKTYLRTSHRTGKYTISSADLAKLEQKRKETESLTQKKKKDDEFTYNFMTSSSMLEKCMDEEKKKRKGRKIT